MSSTLPKSFFDLIQTSETPILVDFWAEWCAPCHTLTPSIKRLAQEYRDTLTVIKINVDEKQHIAQQFGISSIPTLILFDRGKPVMRMAGALPYEQLKLKVDTALKNR